MTKPMFGAREALELTRAIRYVLWRIEHLQKGKAGADREHIEADPLGPKDGAIIVLRKASSYDFHPMTTLSYLDPIASEAFLDSFAAETLRKARE